jgi:hypothetical protein
MDQDCPQRARRKHSEFFQQAICGVECLRRFGRRGRLCGEFLGRSHRPDCRPRTDGMPPELASKVAIPSSYFATVVDGGYP